MTVREHLFWVLLSREFRIVTSFCGGPGFSVRHNDVSNFKVFLTTHHKKYSRCYAWRHSSCITLSRQRWYNTHEDLTICRRRRWWLEGNGSWQGQKRHSSWYRSSGNLGNPDLARWRSWSDHNIILRRQQLITHYIHAVGLQWSCNLHITLLL